MPVESQELRGDMAFKLNCTSIKQLAHFKSAKESKNQTGISLRTLPSLDLSCPVGIDKSRPVGFPARRALASLEIPVPNSIDKLGKVCSIGIGIQCPIEYGQLSISWKIEAKIPPLYSYSLINKSRHVFLRGIDMDRHVNPRKDIGKSRPALPQRYWHV